MHYAALGFITYLACASQLLLSDLGAMAPNVVLLAAVLAVRTLDGWRCLLAAAVIGLLDDVLSGGRIGPAVVGVVAVVSVALRLPTPPHMSAAALAFISGAFAFATLLPATALRLALAGQPADVRLLLGSVAPCAAVSALVAGTLVSIARVLVEGVGIRWPGAGRAG